MVVRPRNHLKLQRQIAQIGRPNRAPFLPSQVQLVAPSRNHSDLGITQVLISARPRNQRAVAKQNPASRPGLSLPERICLASLLVFGDDRSRTPQVEVIVQAGADDVAREAGLRERRTGIHDASGCKRVR
jgi:hypothetical protein